jgi:predicted nuclease of predicted toxin-antitoxin system
MAMTDKIKFNLDENVANEIADALRARGIDVLTTPEAEKRGDADTDQLDYAFKENRVLVTQDRDFLRMARDNLQHAGIVYWRPQSRNTKHIIRELLRIHRELTPNDMVKYIEYL